MQPPPKLETLDDLLAQATHYAEFCMRNSGKMSPTLFLIGADGPLMFVPASLADADEKDNFATHCAPHVYRPLRHRVRDGLGSLGEVRETR